MKMMLSGHCYREKDAPPDQATGIHNQCHGVYARQGGGYYRCPCERHQGENRCRICRHDHGQDIGGFDIADARCADYDACTRRIRPESKKVYDEVAAARKSTTSPTRAGRECECGCGGTTRGGRFQPGHDAKMKSALLRRMRDGDEQAREELKQRKWLKA